MNSENHNSADNAPHTPHAGAGATLRAAREELRLDLAHVAAETRIPLRHLEAIEAGNFESLPSRAYAIGFSRTFAKAVGLDPAEITDAVRAELADGSMRRSAPSSAMEPGDPARMPSTGLTWAAAAAVLVLGIGAFAFFNAYFAAGTEPDTLIAPDPAASSATVASAPIAPNASPTPAASGPVVLTATEDGVWLRLYEEGGERLVERTLMQGETVTVPAAAADPRINTARGDALAITVGGQPVARLSERAVTLSGVPISATALVARPAAPADEASAPPQASLVAPAPRRTAAPRPAAAARPEPAAEVVPASAVGGMANARETAPATRD